MWMAFGGFLLLAAALSVSLWSLRKQDVRKKVAIIGIMGAFMLVAMSMPLGPLPVHLNLGVLAGVILGPALALVCAFVVNLLLALIGHGGVTVIGINSLVLGAEAAVGWAVFSLLRRRLGVTPSAVVATVVAVAISVSLVLGVVSAAGLDPHELAHRHEEGEEVHDAAHETAAAGHEGEEHGEEGFLNRVREGATLILPVGLAGAALESVVVAVTLAFLVKVRPDLIDRGAG